MEGGDALITCKNLRARKLHLIIHWKSINKYTSNYYISHTCVWLNVDVPSRRLHPQCGRTADRLESSESSEIWLALSDRKGRRTPCGLIGWSTQHGTMRDT